MEWLLPSGAVGPPGLATEVQLSAFTIYHGELIAGGRHLAFMDGVETAGIARWNGMTGLPLGEGPGFVTANCLAVLGDHLMAGGLNGPAGGPIIAAWDGEKWRSLSC